MLRLNVFVDDYNRERQAKKTPFSVPHRAEGFGWIKGRIQKRPKKALCLKDTCVTWSPGWIIKTITMIFV